MLLGPWVHPRRDSPDLLRATPAEAPAIDPRRRGRDSRHPDRLRVNRLHGIHLAGVLPDSPQASLPADPDNPSPGDLPAAPEAVEGRVQSQNLFVNGTRSYRPPADQCAGTMISSPALPVTSVMG